MLHKYCEGVPVNCKQNSKVSIQNEREVQRFGLTGLWAVDDLTHESSLCENVMLLQPQYEVKAEEEVQTQASVQQISGQHGVTKSRVSSYLCHGNTVAANYKNKIDAALFLFPLYFMGSVPTAKVTRMRVAQFPSLTLHSWHSEGWSWSTGNMSQQQFEHKQSKSQYK